MKKNVLFYFGLLAFFSTITINSFAQNPVNWTADQLMAPSVLANAIKANNNIPVIINIGPGAIIPNSIDVGPGGNKKNLEKLITQVSQLPKNAAIVVYCGCCPYEHCPNVRPVMDVLKNMKYTNYFLLDLPSNIKTDWISKGYPVVD